MVSSQNNGVGHLNAFVPQVVPAMDDLQLELKMYAVEHAPLKVPLGVRPGFSLARPGTSAAAVVEGTPTNITDYNFPGLGLVERLVRILPDMLPGCLVTFLGGDWGRLK